MGTVLSLDPTMAAAVLVALLPLALAEPSHLIGQSTLGLHPTGVSYSNRSPQGLQVHPVVGYAVHGYGKREAEPFYGYNAIAYHAYGGGRSEARSAQGANYGVGFYGKREAEPYYGYGSHLGSASVSRSQVDRGSFYGTGPAAYNYGFNIRGKRSAEPFYGYGSGVSHQVVSRPFSQYQVSQAHPY